MNASHRSLASHVLSLLAIAHQNGKRAGLETLSADLGVRRADVRATLSQLHREGLVDVTRMRLTLTGFALGSALEGRELAPVRRRAARSHSTHIAA